MRTAKEIAAGFNSDGGTDGYSIFVLQLDRTQMPQAPKPITGIQRMSQARTAAAVEDAPASACMKGLALQVNSMSGWCCSYKVQG